MSGCDLRAGEIKQDDLEAGYYGPWSPEDGPRYYSRLIGVEVRGVYDGVLYWLCPDCGAAWHRWGDINHLDALHDAAQPYIDKANARVSVTNSEGEEVYE